MADIGQESSRDPAHKTAVDQSLFREVNERVEEINTGSGRVAPHSVLVCECADPECAQQLSLTVVEYEKVRANGCRFVVVPGHVSSHDRVVQENERFAVVEKTAGAADVAEKLDPRRRGARRA